MSAFLRSFAVFIGRNYRHYVTTSSLASYRHRHSSSRSNASANSSPLFITILPAFLVYQERSTNTQCSDIDPGCGVMFETSQSYTNWSSTHECQPARVYEPKSTQEVSRVLRLYHDNGMKIRPLGTALSPNGIGFVSSQRDSVISLSSIDHIQVDVNRQLVTVGAGAKVNKILEELEKYGLTLQNFSSIQEQQIGGWTQVSAHGTGCKLSTVDDMIVRMTVAVPTGGILPLSDDNYAELFPMIKVGLGSLGVVTELTLKCMPRIQLEEFTSVLQQSKFSIADHYERLKLFRHVRYMWIPYTDAVISVVSNPTDKMSNKMQSTSSQQATKPMIDLLCHIDPKRKLADVNKLSFSQLRDILLDWDPLNLDHVKKVNAAEASFWMNSQGSRVDDSTNILGFDCGGEQWVLEMCIPIGTLDQATGKDIDFMKKLYKIIGDEGIPAPSPIEQRWTARSTAPMSPAYSTNADDVFSWVGIIMYLPPNQTSEQRQQITTRFQDYCRVIQPLLDEYNAQIHWAKIEIPDADDKERLTALKRMIKRKYPVDEFNRLRKILDPKGILSNDMITSLFDVS